MSEFNVNSLFRNVSLDIVGRVLCKFILVFTGRLQGKLFLSGSKNSLDFLGAFYVSSFLPNDLVGYYWVH